MSNMRVKSAVHAIAILVSLKNQKIKNDFKLMFTFLCISFGAGCRFIGMLNHLGLTVSWQTAMKFFDDKMKRQKQHLDEISLKDIPIKCYQAKRLYDVELYRTSSTYTTIGWH